MTDYVEIRLHLTDEKCTECGEQFKTNELVDATVDSDDGVYGNTYVSYFHQACPQKVNGVTKA